MSICSLPKNSHSWRDCGYQTFECRLLTAQEDLAMKPLVRLFTILMSNFAVAGSLNLNAQAEVSKARVNQKVGRVTENMQREATTNRNIDYESVARPSHDNQPTRSSDKEKSNIEATLRAAKPLSNEGKERRDVGFTGASEQSVNNAPSTPVNAQQERTNYVQDLNWKSSVKATAAVPNMATPSKVQAKQDLKNESNMIKPQKNSTPIESQRQTIGRRLQEAQARLSDKKKLLGRRDLHDPYRDSLVRRILHDVRKAWHDVEESKLHTDNQMEIDKWRAILEEDLRILAKDMAELDRYDSTHSTMRASKRVSKK
jgi:hypothetical protein